MPTSKEWNNLSAEERKKLVQENLKRKLPKDTEPVSYPTIAVMTGAFVLGVAVAVGWHLGKYKSDDPFVVNKCEWAVKEKTGKQVYCGKACFRDELKVTYTCADGIKRSRIE